MMTVSLALGGIEEVGAQSLAGLVGQCPTETGFANIFCMEAALGIQAAQGAMGLAVSGGADLPGSASTLGWRTKGSPRIALSVRGSLTRAPMPSMEGVTSSSAQQVTANLLSMQASATAGVFDGFSLGPTVGGFGSVDLTAFANRVQAPRDQGFTENVSGWGLGGRLGILRESFTLPGVSLSLSRRWVGETELWDQGEGASVGAGLDLVVTSVRGVIGKDVGGVGLFGGMGWDRYSGDASIRVPASVTGSQALEVSGEVQSDRRLYFLGGSMTFIALQISGEVGLAEGFDPELPATSASGFDPGRRSLYGALAFRLTF